MICFRCLLASLLAHPLRDASIPLDVLGRRVRLPRSHVQKGLLSVIVASRPQYSRSSAVAANTDDAVESAEVVLSRERCAADAS
jgi:hypothetical protein